MSAGLGSEVFLAEMAPMAPRSPGVVHSGSTQAVGDLYFLMCVNCTEGVRRGFYSREAWEWRVGGGATDAAVDV